MKKFGDQAQELYDFMGVFGKEQPKIVQGFGTVHHATAEDGALTVKQKELIAVGIAIVIRCEGCIACHVKDALKAGVTREELMETIGVAVLMGGGPSMAYGAKAFAAYEEYTQN